MTDRDDRKHRWWRKRDVAAEGAEAGADGAFNGCLGCDISLLIALTLLAGVPLLIWSL